MKKYIFLFFMIFLPSISFSAEWGPCMPMPSGMWAAGRTSTWWSTDFPVNSSVRWLVGEDAPWYSFGYFGHQDCTGTVSELRAYVSKARCPTVPTYSPVNVERYYESSCTENVAYIPPPLEPSYCTNGVKDSDETGIDCGGSCATPDDVCTSYCPSTFHSEIRTGPDGFTSEQCVSNDDSDYTISAVMGVCPTGYLKSSTDANLCVEFSGWPVYASDDYLLSPSAPDPIDNPWNEVVNDVDTTISTVTTDDAGVITTVTEKITTGVASDGKEVAINETTTKVIALDGSYTENTTTSSSNKTSTGSVYGSSSTVARAYDASGNLLSESVDTVESESEEGASNPFARPGLISDDSIVDVAVLDAFITRWSTFSDVVGNAPVFAPLQIIFDGPNVAGKTPTFSLAMGSYGEKSFTLSGYDSIWNALGYLFIFLAVWSAARTIMFRGMSSSHV